LHNKISEYKNIRELDVSNNEFEGIEECDLIPNLTHLILSSNKIVENIIFKSGRMEHLSYLDLSNNQLTAVNDIRALKSLK